MHSVSLSRPYILYIEDDPEDVELLKHALSDTNFDHELVHISNGVDGLEFLEYAKQYARLPEMVLLDVNLSKLDGKETLLCIKADKDLARIPVAVLSTSSLEADISYFSQYHIPYMVKSGDIKRYKEELIEVLKGSLAFDFNFPATRKKTDAA